MKNSVKKILAGVILATTMIAPTITSAYSNCLTWGHRYSDGHYTWAEKNNASVWARMITSSGGCTHDTGKKGGWIQASTYNWRLKGSYVDASWGEY